MQIKDSVREFIATNFYVPDPAVIADEDSLLDQGIIDSTGVLELIVFLEDEFKIKIEDDEVIPSNLDSIAQITSYVQRKKTSMN